MTIRRSLGRAGYRAISTRLLLVLAVLAPSPSAAKGLEGAWELRSGQTRLFRIDIVRSGHHVVARWTRPRSFEYDGRTFVVIDASMVVRRSVKVKIGKADGNLTFADPTPGSRPDEFRIRKDGAGASLTYSAAALPPYRLERAIRSRRASAPTSGEAYEFERHQGVNAEMASIYEADQLDRQVERPDWHALAARDTIRRQRTQALIDAGALDGGSDFYDAAFVFQHGDGPADYLKAHLLALVAIARGRPDAVWIASATMDRYLLSIGRPQVLGTQFMGQGARETQQPFDRLAVPDTLRTALRVPVLKAQDDQLARDRNP